MSNQIVRQIKQRELTGTKIKINPWWCKEQCIMCKTDTQYPQPTPISVRRYYVEGLGQMCPSCYYATYCHAMVNDEFISEIFS